MILIKEDIYRNLFADIKFSQSNKFAETQKATISTKSGLHWLMYLVSALWSTLNI